MYMKKSCIIGYNGFVGSNLIRQYDFDLFYNSKNYKEIENKEFNLVVCCGISAAKWWANLNGNEDLNNINNLLNSLKTIKCNRFVLISTIDVYDNINGDFNEDTIINSDINHNYGKNRYYVEKFVIENFKIHNIIRLGGLFGFGLKKNLIFDLLNDKNPTLCRNSNFQWYYLGDLKKDIDYCINNEIKVINLFNEPISMNEIVNIFNKYKNTKFVENENSINYDLKTKYFKNGYLNDKNLVLNQLDKFLWLNIKKNICVSNLGYDLNLMDKIIEIEKFYNIEKREIVPFKTFGKNFEFKKMDYFNIHNELKIYSMQSILYPHTENIINLKEYLIKLIDISSYLNIQILVFGSPKNRSLKNMSEDEFIKFMKEIGDYAFEKNVIIVIEPNAKIYNCDFITNSNEAINIINKINSKGVKLHLDTGCMYLENENIIKVFENNIDNIYHIHFSAPNLINLFNFEKINYKEILDLLWKLNYNNYITVELLNKSPTDIDKCLHSFLN